MTEFFKSYPRNEYGEDFVVGDLHGQRQALLDELDRQGFDKTKDRLFCTGDLIDRGPDSFGTLELIFEPWFYFVRGNHELDLVFNMVDWDGRSHFKGAQDWHFFLHDGRLDFIKEKMLPRIVETPIVLRVEGSFGFWVVHADRGTLDREDGRLKLLDDAALPEVEKFNHLQFEALFWSRRLLREALLEESRQNFLHFESVPGQEFEPGVGLTFVGHSVVERPILYRSHLFIDTGAAFIPHGRVTVLRVKEVYRRLSLRGSMFAGTDFSQVTIKYRNEDF